MKPRPPIKNRSKPIQKKSLLEQTHSKKIITGATGANPFKKKIITGANPFKSIQKKSSPEQTHLKNIITGATGANPFKKNHHRSHKSKSIQKNERDERADGEQRRERR